MGKENGYAPSVFDVDIEKGTPESPKPNDETAEHMKFESTFLRVVQREISLQIGDKNAGKRIYDKNAGKRIYDTFMNRSRKYKRSASFNSRRVFLLFSVVSIIGTMILIYLTLRVRQITHAAASA